MFWFNKPPAGIALLLFKNKYIDTVAFLDSGATCNLQHITSKEMDITITLKTHTPHYIYIHTHTHDISTVTAFCLR
jgi:cell wall assembly regulator SMI1